jgi:hypothetical protein
LMTITGTDKNANITYKKRVFALLNLWYLY